MKNPEFLSPGQARVLEKLRPLAGLATNGICKQLPFFARTATLIAGPSGTGKSHVARVLGREMKLPIWQGNVANWMIMGSRSDTPTFASLVTWVSERQSGIIILDELDKLTGTSDWTNSCRLEIHELLDFRVPEAAVSTPGSSLHEERSGDTTKNLRRGAIKKDVEEKLRNNFFIIGAGAWQAAWQENRQENRHEAGSGDPSPAAGRIDNKQMLRSVTPEIRQRFRNDVCFLEPMSKSDYLSVAASIMHRLPKTLLPKFLAAWTPAVEIAVDECLGMRMIEEVLADVWAEEFALHANNPLVLAYLTKHQ